jgi:prolipoprotein diacylglyceryltransferase
MDEVLAIGPRLERQHLILFANELAKLLSAITQQRKAPEPYTTDYLRSIAAEQHSAWVHPTQVYAIITLFLLFVILSAILRLRARPGMVVASLLILYPINRFVMEVLRGDNPHDVAGFTISQFISIVAIIGGIVMVVVLLRRPFPPPAAPEPTAPDGPTA